jgi:hypothetical protein
MASLNENAVISGNFQLETTTGSVQLDWINVDVSSNIPISVKTTTGSAELNITQTRQLFGNITINAEATTGSVLLYLDVHNDIGAKISASTSMGGVNVEQRGFTGNEVPLQSDNYPARSNLDITLRTTIGGIGISAGYDLEGIRS